MGQPITVLEKHSSRPGIVRYEANRPLSGMGHERWEAGQVVEGSRPVDELARRLLATGEVDAVHVNGSVVTVTLGRGQSGADLADVIRGLFRFYGDAPADAGDGAGVGHGESIAAEPTAAELGASEPAAEAAAE